MGLQGSEQFVRIENMAISSRLLDILACPICKTGVKVESGSDALRCPSCLRIFPVHDGVPIMLLENSVVPSD